MMERTPDEYQLLVEREIEHRQAWLKKYPKPIPPVYAPWSSNAEQLADIELANTLKIQVVGNYPELYEQMAKFRNAAYAAASLEFLEPEKVQEQEKGLIAPYTSIEDVVSDLALLRMVGLAPDVKVPGGINFPRLYQLCNPFRRAYEHAAQPAQEAV